MIIKYRTKKTAHGRKINKMAHLEEKGAGKAPRLHLHTKDRKQQKVDPDKDQVWLLC
jgi:hypothetical protein